MLFYQPDGRFEAYFKCHEEEAKAIQCQSRQAMNIEFFMQLINVKEYRRAKVYVNFLKSQFFFVSLFL